MELRRRASVQSEGRSLWRREPMRSRCGMESMLKKDNLHSLLSKSVVVLVTAYYFACFLLYQCLDYRQEGKKGGPPYWSNYSFHHSHCAHTTFTALSQVFSNYTFSYNKTFDRVQLHCLVGIFLPCHIVIFLINDISVHRKKNGNVRHWNIDTLKHRLVLCEVTYCNERVVGGGLFSSVGVLSRSLEGRESGKNEDT